MVALLTVYALMAVSLKPYLQPLVVMTATNANTLSSQ